MGQRGKLRALTGKFSCPRKLFLTQRKSRFSGGSLFSETSACSLSSLSSSHAPLNEIFAFLSVKHQIEFGLHADVSEDRLALEQRLQLV